MCNRSMLHQKFLLPHVLVFCCAAGIMSSTTTTVYLRHGAQLSTDAPLMSDVSKQEMEAVPALHKNTQVNGERKSLQ